MKGATLLVTGAAGFIGSHTIVELMAAGFNVVGVDNYSNSQMDVIERIKKLKTEVLHIHDVDFQVHDLDVRDVESMMQLFKAHPIQGVIHFAGLKAVGESFLQPLAYWENNVGGTMSLIKVMQAHHVKHFVFSSSATVYGNPMQLPIAELAPTSSLSPYGRTKWVCEQFLQDFSRANPSWNISLLRYFNPVGAHPSGLIGELPRGVPNNLMPFVTQVAAGLREKLSIFGQDYETADGTCIRDYIHVVDLAQGHVAALKAMMARSHGGDDVNQSVSKIETQDCAIQGLEIFNFGTGQGVSVKELVETFERVNGVPVPHHYVGRREGDVPVLFADVNKAQDKLGWRAQKNLEEMCKDAWRWQCNL